MKPIHAHGFFTVSRNGLFYEIIVFDYYDPEEYYAHLIHKPLDYEKEMARLIQIMQETLDEEYVSINGERIRPKVVGVDLGHRGFSDTPFITFLIYFKGRLRRGENVYENRYEESVAEYDYEVYWFFPPGFKVVEVDFRTDYEVLGSGNLLYVWARKGDKTGGREFIKFKKP